LSLLKDDFDTYINVINILDNSFAPLWLQPLLGCWKNLYPTGLDRIRSDGIGLTKPRFDQQKYKVAFLKFLPKMATWYLWIKMAESKESILTALFLLFPSAFCRQDFLFFVLHKLLPSLNFLFIVMHLNFLAWDATV